MSLRVGLSIFLWLTTACSPHHLASGPDVPSSMTRLSQTEPEIHFTRPGISPDGPQARELAHLAAAFIDSAQFTLDVAAYELDAPEIYEAIIRAKRRGVLVRFVGDEDEEHDAGYEALDAAGVDMCLRPAKNRIMHHKFMVADQQLIWTGSMNLSNNGVQRNNNAAVTIPSWDLARAYTREFETMFSQELFGPQKPNHSPSGPFSIGTSQVWADFSPGGLPYNLLIEAINAADSTVLFMIFSFTDNDLADAMIWLHQRGVQVVGIMDSMQAGQRYSVDETLADAGIPIYIDGNRNQVRGGGGKLHHKMMIVDADTTSRPMVALGSYNWSTVAAVGNDENLVLIEDAGIASAARAEFCEVLSVATLHPSATAPRTDPCSTVQPVGPVGPVEPVEPTQPEQPAGQGAVLRIQEVMANPTGWDNGMEWVEIVNRGDMPVDLAGYSLGDLTNSQRHVFDHFVLQPREAVIVQSGPYAWTGPHIIASTASLGLTNVYDEITLRDRSGTVADDIYYYGAQAGISMNREDDDSSPYFVPHHWVDGSTSYSSPGTKADGTRW